MFAVLLSIFSFSFGAPITPDSVELPAAAEIVSDSTRQYVEIDNIFIIGNRRTRERIILREMSFKKGEMLHLPDLQGHLEADRKKLLNTHLFNSVEITTLELTPSKVDIVIRVDERWYTFPVPIFELIDRNFNDWWVNRNHDFKRVRYGLRFDRYNMRGSNEDLRLIAQFGITRRYGILYNIPYLDKGQRHGVRVQANYKENINHPFKTEGHKQMFYNSEDILYQEINAEASYTYRGKFYTFHEAGVIYKKGQISDSLLLLNPNYFNEGQKNQQYLSIYYRLKQDRRDFVSYPLNGYKAELELEKIGVGVFNDVNILKIDLDYSKFFDLGHKFYLANYTHLNYTTPEPTGYANYDGMGNGKDLVRGFETYVIEGSSYFLNKTSLKRTLIDGKINLFGFIPKQFKTLPYAIYLKTFFDIGYVNNLNNYGQNSRLTDKWIYGGGIGLDIVTYYDFVFRLEYTFNSIGETWFVPDVNRGF